MSKTLLLVLVLLLAGVAAVAVAPDSNSQPTGAPVLRTYLMPDLSVKSMILLPQAGTLASQPDTVAAANKRTGFCRCSCGYPCTSSADCGGVSCDPFITCCARKQNPEAEWFTRGYESSSRNTAPPEQILKASCQ
jgi:hypothetical protein